MKKLLWLLLGLLIFTGCSEEEIRLSPDYDEALNEIFQGEWGVPGLVTAEGEAHTSPTYNETIGTRHNVLDYGAVSDDPEVDNSVFFQAAIDAAEDGDEVYIPNGHYYFSEASLFTKSYVSHLTLKSGVNFIGESKENTVLISNFDANTNEKYKSTVILARSESNIVIANMTVTSNTDDSQLPDPDVSNLNNFVETAPVYGVVIDNDKPIQTHGNVLIQNLLIEKFQRMGIRIRLVNNVVVEACTLQKATDLGGGGAGYGISIQGMSNGADLTGSNLDTVHNIVRDCEIIGPYMRHGILLQYFAHHNLIYNNTVKDTLLDAIDLHGEDEYGNEVAYNTIINTRRGAAIGVGNSGATHDAAGPNNYIHHNTISEGDRGIDILYGTPNTVVQNNSISNIPNEDGTGIFIQNGHGSYIDNNTIEGFTGLESQGIVVLYSYNALEPELGVPDRIHLTNNKITDLQDGIYIEAHTELYTYEKNKLKKIRGTDYVDGQVTFIVPPISDVVIPRQGDLLLPTDDNFITNEGRDYVQSQSNMKFKASYHDVPYNRMIYVKFDLSEAPKNKEKVYLRLSSKSKDGLATINIHGSETYTDWKEATITWNNALYHKDDVAAILDENNELDYVTDFTYTTVGTEFNTYYIDITDYIQQVESKYLTLILSNDAVENMYCEIYSKETSKDEQKLGLLYSND